MSRRHPEIVKRLTKLSIPEQAVPHVRFMFAEMARQRVTYEDLEWKSGILKNTLKAWRHKNQPNLNNIEACLNALNWSLMPVPSASAVPPAILAKLAPLAEELGLTMPATTKILIEIAAGLAKAEKAAPPKHVVGGNVVAFPARRRRAPVAPHPDQIGLLEAFNVAA